MYLKFYLMHNVIPTEVRVHIYLELGVDYIVNTGQPLLWSSILTPGQGYGIANTGPDDNQIADIFLC